MIKKWNSKYALKKYLCLMLTMALMLTAMPTGAFAAENKDAVSEADIETASEDIAGEAAEEAAAAADGEETSEGGESTPSQNTAKADIEINQCFSNHTGLNDGVEKPMTQYVAKKKTAVMIKIPGSDADGYTRETAESQIKNYRMEAKAVSAGQESGNPELSASGDSFRVVDVFDVNCEREKGFFALTEFTTGPDAGTYNFYWYNGNELISNPRTATFYETKKLNILIVPVKAYWSKACAGAAPEAGAYSCKDEKFNDAADNPQPWENLKDAVKDYLLDVYPVADINIEEGAELDASDPKYDMVAEGDGQRLLWEKACKLQTKKKDGTDRYDLILAFVRYRQDEGTGQGYTFGKPTNIITYTDSDVLPTVAHEIAHCYQVGDEYNGGSFNSNVNFPPNNYKGRNFVTGQDIASTSGANEYWQTPEAFKSSASGALKDKIYTGGSGIVVKLSLHPYSFKLNKFLTWGGTDANGAAVLPNVYPTLGYMGSGNTYESGDVKKGTDGFNWTTSVIWDHLLGQLAVKSKKAKEASPEEAPAPESSEEQVTNAAVFANAEISGAEATEDDPLNEEEDFYYDDGYRFGESRMVEVSGTLSKGSGSSDPVVSMKPMFSYQGDLETIEVLDETYRATDDVYTFAALDSEGKVIFSTTDEDYNERKAEDPSYKGMPSACEFYGGFFNPSMKNGTMLDKVNFGFDAEYPEDTKDFVIFRGKLDEIAGDGTLPRSVIWQASADENFKGDPFGRQVGAEVTYADVNSFTADMEWELTGVVEEEDKKNLYTEVYYCPEGDDGESIYIGSSADGDENAENIKNGYVSFQTGDKGWSRNAYVWVKITNGVNAVDLYSDELEITVANSTLKLSGAGIKQNRQNGMYETTFTGSALEPTVSVAAYDPSTGKSITLKKDTDYRVTYENNVNAGTATAVVQGIGLYGGKNTIDFEILPAALAAAPGDIPDIVWSGNLDNEAAKYLSMSDAKGNRLSLYDKSKSKGDFTVSYTVDGKEADSLLKLIPASPETKKTVTVKYAGRGNYTGECKTKVSFDVLPGSGTESRDLSGAQITLKKTSMPYTGKPQKPAIKEVKLGDKKLGKSDYKVVYSDNTGVGTGRVTVVGKKGYVGSAYADFTITEKEVTSLSVTGLKNQSYTGSAIKVEDLPIVVKAGGITLVKGRDYTVEAKEGCDLVSVTTSEIKRDKKDPGIVVRLKTRPASAKSSECPVVKWKSTVKPEKQLLQKSFAITATKLDSAAVNFTTVSKDAAKNVVLDKAGGRKIGNIMAAPKSEMKQYTYIIEGEADELIKDAYIEDGAYLIGPDGKGISSEDYTVTVSKTKDGRIGSITYKAKKTSKFYTGSKVIKFRYDKVRLEDEEEETPEVKPEV